MMFIGARAVFCAGHTLPRHPNPHGHSYEVWAYTDKGCVEDWQKLLAEVCSILDHSMLNEIISEPTMENIARFVADKMDARRVNVIRPVEGLCAEHWRR